MPFARPKPLRTIVGVSVTLFVIAVLVGAVAVGASTGTGSTEVSRILFLRGGGPCGCDLLAIDPVSGAAQRLTHGHLDGGPRWSPDGRRIAFGRLDGAIYIINADGTHLRRLVSGGHPSWSPNGRRLAFTRSSEATYTGGVFVIDADGRHLRRIAYSFRASGAAWSPDGQRIVYNHEHPDIWNEIRIVNQDGSDDRLLVGGLGDNAVGSVWSPDSSTIAFVRFVDRSQFAGGINSRIYLINTKGTNSRSLTGETSPTVNEQDPSWSPDGRQIAFVRDISGRILLSEVDLINADGTDRRTLARQTQGGWGWAPSWSPDGRRVAFISRRDKNLDLYVANADGTRLRRLTHTRVFEFDPRWQPSR